MGFVPTNQTLGCDYPSIDAFLLDAIQTNSSINLTIANCPDLCGLAWGTGNPDLSGVGVMISYWIQLAVFWIFGSLFSIWMLLPVRDINIARRNSLFIAIRQILLGLYTSAAIFSISVALAAKIRHDQGPPFFELSFLESVITMLALNFFGITILVLAVVNSSLTWFYVGAPVPSYRYILNVSSWLKTNHNGITRQIGLQPLGRPVSTQVTAREPTGFPIKTVWQFLPFIYSVILFIVVVLFNVQSITAKDTVLAHNDLFSACPEYAKILLHSISENLIPDHKIWDGARAKMIIASIVTFLIVAAVSVGIAQSPYLVAVFCTGLCVGATYYMSEMQTKRNAIRKLTDPTEFEDDQWGLGQVLAVVVWFQLIPQIAEAFVGEKKHEL